MLKKLQKRDTDKDLTYEEARQRLERDKGKDKRMLARGRNVAPEILYYLAKDDSVDIRRDVARNPSTPIQADSLLCGDDDDEVREELARKIARLLPGLPPDENERLREEAITILEQLARDALPKVRRIVAEELKETADVPKEIIRRLADDAADEVSCPVLEFSPLLGDDDLREIIAAGASVGALKAIANRSNVSESVSDDIAATLEIPAVASLLANPNAQIREETLDRIIDQARDVQSLHEPLAMRPNLSIRAMKRIAGFVASALVHGMIERNELEEATAEAVLERVRKRIRDEQVGADEEQQLAEQARNFHRRGMLNDEFISECMDENRRELAIQCLAVMADLPAKTVRQIILSKSGRAVVALAWKAGLSARVGFDMQTRLAIVSPAQLVAAKEGRDYPMDESEMVWHLSYYND